MTGTAQTDTYTFGLASAGRGRAADTYTHDSYGRVVTDSDVPDTTEPSLDTCTTTTYADSSSAWI